MAAGFAGAEGFDSLALRLWEVGQEVEEVLLRLLLTFVSWVDGVAVGNLLELDSETLLFSLLSLLVWKKEAMLPSR